MSDAALDPLARALSEATLRVARPTNDIEPLLHFYCEGVGLSVLSRFADHAGFDGAIVGAAGCSWHLEFVTEKGVIAPRAPSPEHLLVLYYADFALLAATESRLRAQGQEPAEPHNPFWKGRAILFKDPDGYRIALHRGPWRR